MATVTFSEVKRAYERAALMWSAKGAEIEPFESVFPQFYGPRPTLALLKTTPRCSFCGGSRGTRRSCDGCGAS